MKTRNTSNESINYIIAPNGSTNKNGERGYHARVSSNGSITLEQAWQSFEHEDKDKDLSLEQMLRSLKYLRQLKIETLCQGKSLMIPELSLTFRNKFEGSTPQSEFTLPINDINLTTDVEVGHDFTDELLEKVNFVHTSNHTPSIDRIKDSKTQSSQYQSPGMLTIYGDNLKLNEEAHDEGVFIRLPDGQELPLSVAESTNGKIITMIPEDVSGTLALTVKTRHKLCGILHTSLPYELHEVGMTETLTEDAQSHETIKNVETKAP